MRHEGNRQISKKGSGIFPVDSRMTLLEAIAHAKGHNELNKAKRVAVVREVDGQRVSTVFDLASIRSGQEPDPEIFDDDVIVVEGAKTKRTLRDMLKGISLRDLFKPAGS